ncbi:MAG: presqualene diphosphate synthase HpnD [Magnetococcales bacterium]|nr:presqualene diphosphate synthase HpnD [Magnetococcales bacterium]MBF0114490.1 presqualene diphosphate synthase HpnD [Magnetococcales bacterium]
MTPADYCRRKTLAANSSFFLPFFFLPPPRRGAMYALYAFCREVDDVVDSGLPTSEAAAQLQAWRERLRLGFAGQGEHPIIQELIRYRTLFALPEEPFYEILAGMEMDLSCHRYQDLAQLQRYCYRVAVTVGVLAVRIFSHGQEPSGWSAERGHLFAQHLGEALQLTNIVRDVAEDARMGRIYLPLQWLQEAGVQETDLLHARDSAALRGVLQRLAARAEESYRAADALLPQAEERRMLLPALFMGAIYRQSLQRLQRAGFPCFAPRQRTALWRKLHIIWRCWRMERQRWC